MNKIKLLAILLVFVLSFGMLVSCNKPVEYGTADEKDAVTRSDFTSVYDEIGSKVTIDMVTTDEDGMAYVTVDGVKYELGMDFLSMAMVYNCTPAGEFETETEVYNEWWKHYIVRWNYLVPEIPLYSNQYFDLYNKKISGFVTSPYWSAADAIVSSTVTTADNSVILGSATALSGAFRNSAWGKSSPAASDQDVQKLTSGYATAESNKGGAYAYNMNALAAEPTFTLNEDGSKTVTLQIKQGLKFSDGSAITAKNYIAGILANSTAVAVEAKGSGNSGMQIVGFDAFKAYTGEGETVYFEGIKLLDDYTFSVTYIAEYANYYYLITMAAFSPDPLQLYLGSKGDIVVNEDKECGLNAAFYEKETKNGIDSYVVAGEITENLKWDSDLPYSGPYVVSNYDTKANIATLTLNPQYTQDVRGKATIQTITYIKVVTETQMDMFKAGEVDVIEGITGGKETEAALAVVEAAPTKYAETHYDRAGYGKLAFRCDLGPTAFTEVRQAIMHTLNRPAYAQKFTGGFGAVVNGPYYTGADAYVANKTELESLLNPYAYSADDAIAVLEEGGWIYNVEGKEFDAEEDDVRYKKLSGYELSKANIFFSTVDTKYKTVKIGDDYYMPLAINWYGTQPNDVTDLLVTEWQATDTATKSIGMYIQYITCEFVPGVYGDYCQMTDYGYQGTPYCNAINFATGFNSAVYDQSYYWTIDPDLYDTYSNNYIMDEADFFSNYAK